MSYQVKQDYIARGTKRRSGLPIGKVAFLVAHDTGNDGSTAQNNVDYYKRSANEMSASAHTFIDDKNIIECVPITEKAWHVRYDVQGDNKEYGDDANDVAIGIELCFHSKNEKVNNLEAYKRYVWYMADLCNKFGLNPLEDIIGHSKLDPARKTDPENALKHIGKDFDDLVLDVNKELAKIREANKPKPETKPTPKPTPKPPAPKPEVKECGQCLTKEDADKLIAMLQDAWHRANTDAKKAEIGRQN